jgi:hypothetical protein
MSLGNPPARKETVEKTVSTTFTTGVDKPLSGNIRTSIIGKDGICFLHYVVKNGKWNGGHGIPSHFAG